MVELSTTEGVFLPLDEYNKFMADRRRLLAIIELHDERHESCPTLGCWLPSSLVGIDIREDMERLEVDMGLRAHSSGPPTLPELASYCNICGPDHYHVPRGEFCPALREAAKHAIEDLQADADSGETKP